MKALSLMKILRRGVATYEDATKVAYENIEEVIIYLFYN